MKLQRLLCSVLFLPAIAAFAWDTGTHSAPPGSAAPAIPNPDLQTTQHQKNKNPKNQRDPNMLYRDYTRKGENYQARQLYSEAEKYYRLSFDISRRSFGDGPRTASALNRIGQACFLQGHYLQARSCFRSSLRIYQLQPGKNVSASLVVMGNLAATEEELGNLTRAEETFREAVDSYDRLAPNHPCYGTVLTNFALLLASMGDIPTAQQAATRGVSLLKKQGMSMELAAGMITLARIDILLRSFAEADDLLTRARRGLYQIGGVYTTLGATVLTHQARLYAATGRDEEARPLFEQAIRLYQRFLNPGHPAVLAAMRCYARFLRDNKEKKAARKVEAQIARNEQAPRLNAAASMVDVQTLLRENGH